MCVAAEKSTDLRGQYSSLDLSHVSLDTPLLDLPCLLFPRGYKNAQLGEPPWRVAEMTPALCLLQNVPSDLQS